MFINSDPFPHKCVRAEILEKTRSTLTFQIRYDGVVDDRIAEWVIPNATRHYLWPDIGSILSVSIDPTSAKLKINGVYADHLDPDGDAECMFGSLVC